MGKSKVEGELLRPARDYFDLMTVRVAKKLRDMWTVKSEKASGERACASK
jgi:hypothetical protein